MNDTIVLIPVRLQATRFPNKPFAKIGDLPMLHYVYNAAFKSNFDVFLAICDEEIQDYCQKHQISFVMTNPNHPSGSDRIGEALSKIEEHTHYSFIINVQGDMPFINQNYIQSLRSNLDNFKMTSLACPFIDKQEAKSPSKVKVEIDDTQNIAIDFSRQIRDEKNLNKTIFHHIGVYGYQKNFLKKYISLPQTQRELDEKLEQLRILDLENIHITCVNNEILGVDTKEDLDRVNQIIQEHE
jgi:3-deoxy-manno-octulosonate cytidylyltransferase (CMP-KDO synthetase)